MYLATQIKDEKSLNQKILLRANSDDELREASIRQRVRCLENNLFDEYWDELLVSIPHIGSRGDIDESSRNYVHKYTHNR